MSIEGIETSITQANYRGGAEPKHIAINTAPPDETQHCRRAQRDIRSPKKERKTSGFKDVRHPVDKLFGRVYISKQNYSSFY